VRLFLGILELDKIFMNDKQYLGDGVYAEYSILGELKLTIPSENTEGEEDIVIILGQASQVMLGRFIVKSTDNLSALLKAGIK
jgi:hypothetical protein